MPQHADIQMNQKPMQSVTVKPVEEKIAVDVPKSMQSAHVRIDPSMHGSMKFAALTGILLVTMSVVTFYFGVDFLRASLTGTTQEVDVTITAEGHFDPSTVTLVPGDTLTITSHNIDPQVIKSKDERELFPVQILETDQSYSFDVPLSAVSAEFTYFSETLPNDRELTITITSQTQGSSSSVQSSNDILIPLLNDMSSSSVSSVRSSSSVSQMQIPVNQSSSMQPVPEVNPFGGTAKIETNPYTVGNKRFSSSSSLHGGAPLNPRKPRTSPETGPGLWLLGVCALATVGFMYSRQKKSLNK